MIGRLQEFRHQAGYTQSDVAQRIKMSRHWVRKIESCELRLDVLHLILLCRVYGQKAYRVVQKMEEEPEEGGSFFYLLGFNTRADDGINSLFLVFIE